MIQRFVEKDRPASSEFIDAYGHFIWALARQITASNEEAEAANQEIFADI